MPKFMFVLDVDFLFTFVLKNYTLDDLIDIRAIIYIIVENVLQCLSCTSQIKSNTIDIKKKYKLLYDCQIPAFSWHMYIFTVCNQITKTNKYTFKLFCIHCGYWILQLANATKSVLPKSNFNLTKAFRTNLRKLKDQSIIIFFKDKISSLQKTRMRVKYIITMLPTLLILSVYVRVAMLLSIYRQTE